MYGPVISFSGLKEGHFLERPNRFLILARLPGEGVVEAHLHDPGRLKEILREGRRLLLREARGRRKTRYDVIAGEDGGEWVFIHSGYHRRISRWVILNNVIGELGEALELRDEVPWGGSRIDHLLRNRTGEDVLIEVKGCTLASDGVALFPDAPTVRGRRHVEELMGAKEGGFRAAIIFLVFRKESRCFRPNGETDPAFEEAFCRALSAGVEAYPLLFSFDGRDVRYAGRLPLCINPSELPPP